MIRLSRLPPASVWAATQPWWSFALPFLRAGHKTCVTVPELPGGAEQVVLRYKPTGARLLVVADPVYSTWSLSAAPADLHARDVYLMPMQAVGEA